MDTAVRRIRPTDLELSQVQDNLADAIQQLLDYANGTNSPQSVLSPVLQQLRGPGTPFSIKTPALQINGDPQNTGGTTVLIGTPPTSEIAQQNANVALYGNLVINGSTQTAGALGVVAGLNAFYILCKDPNLTAVAMFLQNVNGVANWILGQDGAVIAQGTYSAPSFVSRAGFKTVVPMGFYYHTAYPGGQKATLEPVVNTANNGPNYKTARYIAPRAGSVTAISIDLEFAVNGNTDAGVVINGAQRTYLNIMGPNATKGYVAFTKGSVPFNANDAISCLIGWGAAPINACASVKFEVELGA